MEHGHRLKIVLGVVSAALLIFVFGLIYFCRKRWGGKKCLEMQTFECKEKDEVEPEDLISFPGGESLTTFDILDAPGEVIGKSSYGTLYKASLQRSDSVMLLRFIRPVCTGRMKEILPEIQMLGFVRHPNLVPLEAAYAGSRGEKLLVHPFYGFGNLAQFIRDGNSESHKWAVIYRISLGIARGLDHLHTGLPRPIIHGNLKSKNVLLDQNYHPYLSDFGLHMLLNPTASHEMLESSASQGYKAPELIKMKEVGKESDIYSLGVIFLEIISWKEPINRNLPKEDIYLPNSMQNALINHRLSDLFHPNLLLTQSSDQNPISKECILMFFQLAMACCSPSPSLRPDIKQVLLKLEEIGKS